MLRLSYVAATRLPSEKAHGLQIAHTCESLAKAGASVELIAPRRRNLIREDLFSFYGLKRCFAFTEVGVPDTVFLEPFGFFLNQVLFSVVMYVRALRKRHGLWYTRDLYPALALILARAKVVFEMHDFPTGNHALNAWMCRRALRIVTTNVWAKRELVERYGIPEGKILVYPNGVDLDAFSLAMPKEKAREELLIAEERPIALYSGHLYEWKGVSVFSEAASHLRDISCMLVGGSRDELDAFTKAHPSTHAEIIGYVPHQWIPLYLRAADVLVIPNVPITQHSEFSTSPIKLFEYMASGRPIVASDLPSIREIVDESMVLFVPPGDAEALAEGIRGVLERPDEALKRAQKARQTVVRYAWDERGKAIYSFLKKAYAGA